MSSTSELDAFRAELLRQKIVFEAELRRQRETTEDQVALLTKKLAERENENKSLQAALTVMGKKFENMQEQIIKMSNGRAASVTRGRETSRANSPATDRSRQQSPVPMLRMPSENGRPASASRAPSLYSRAQSGSRPASPGATPRTTTSTPRESPAAVRPMIMSSRTSTATVPTVRGIQPRPKQTSRPSSVGRK